MSKKEFPTPIENPPELMENPPEPVDEMVFCGRKALFNNSLVIKMKEYLDSPLYEDITDDDGKLVKRVPSEMPSIVGLALILGVHRKTVHVWRSKYPQFGDYVELLKQKQKRWLLYHGLLKNIDSNFGKFVAINATDMVDKKEHAISNETIQINIDSNDAEL